VPGDGLQEGALDAIALTQQPVQFDTRNPPGHEARLRPLSDRDFTRSASRPPHTILVRARSLTENDPLPPGLPPGDDRYIG
jgi:hypothetical protein